MKNHVPEENTLHHSQATEFMHPSQRGVFAPEISSQLGSYTIEAEVGKGSYGSVYRARERTAMGRVVALKILPPRGGSDGLHFALREARALDRLVHPSIARVLDAGNAPNGAAYIAMDFVDGPTLSQWCRETNPSLESRLGILLDVCAAAQYAHEHGTIHRDLKPSNVMIRQESDAVRGVVIDFGVASIARSDDAPRDDSLGPGASFGVGTIETMAPEQLAVGALPDIRSDIYSIGATIYWTLTGHAPFERRDASPTALAELVTRIRTVSVLPLRKVGLSRGVRATSRQWKDLDAVLARALAKNPADRYRSVAELAEDLASVRRGRAPSVAAKGWTAQVVRVFRRHRGLVATCTLIVVTLTVATIISVRFALKEHESRVAADAARADQTQAVEALRTALRSVVQDVRAVGDAPQLMRHWPSVIEAFSRTYGPTHGLTMAQRYRYSEFLLTSKKFAEGLEVLEAMEAIALPENAHTILACVRFRAAQCHEGLGDRARALEVLEQTLAENYPKLKPCDTAAHLWSAIALRGRLLCAMGNKPEGIDELRRAVKVQAECHGGGGSINDTQARGLLFEALADAGRIDEALGVIEALLSEIDAKGSTTEILIRVWVRRLEARRLALLLDRAPGADKPKLIEALRATAIDWMRYSGLDMDSLREVNRALEAAGSEPITKEVAEEGIRRLNAFTSAPSSF